jgi:hypothetical protein
MDKHDIIPGYQGIMPLNLYSIDSMYRKQAIVQHLNDIKVYTQYQNNLSPRLRYENTIGRIIKLHKKDNDALEKRALVKQIEDAKRHQMVIDRRLTE